MLVAMAKALALGIERRMRYCRSKRFTATMPSLLHSRMAFWEGKVMTGASPLRLDAVES